METCCELFIRGNQIKDFPRQSAHCIFIFIIVRSLSSRPGSLIS